MRFPKPQPKAIVKIYRQRASERNRRDIYAAVDKRDGYRCRACGRSVSMTGAVFGVMKGHRHHLKFRSAGGKDWVQNLLLLCAVCHWDVHQHRLQIIGTDANTPLKFKKVA